MSRPPAEKSPPSVQAAPWLDFAVAEIGVTAGPSGRGHPRIAEYHRTANLAGRDDQVPWCSSFVHWCLAQAGIAGTGSPLARSWLSWGDALDEPVRGCVVVLYREEPQSWKGHVGFFLRADADRLHLLGGNQLGAVRVHSYPRETLLGFRWPTAHAPMPRG